MQTASENLKVQDNKVIAQAFAFTNVTIVRIGLKGKPATHFRFSATLFSAGWTIRKDRKAVQKGLSMADAEKWMRSQMSCLINLSKTPMDKIVVQVGSRELKTNASV